MTHYTVRRRARYGKGSVRATTAGSVARLIGVNLYLSIETDARRPSVYGGGHKTGHHTTWSGRGGTGRGHRYDGPTLYSIRSSTDRSGPLYAISGVGSRISVIRTPARRIYGNQISCDFYGSPPPPQPSSEAFYDAKDTRRVLSGTFPLVQMHEHPSSRMRKSVVAATCMSDLNNTVDPQHTVCQRKWPQ